MLTDVTLPGKGTRGVPVEPFVLGTTAKTQET